MPRDAPATRFLNRPMALLPSWRPAVLYPDDTPATEGRGPVVDLVGKVAIIPVSGILVHGAYGFGYGETTYASIRTALCAALADDSVSGIALHIDSPGGEVAGCADLADAIVAARGSKPMHAIVDEMACSAAFWLASACDRITVPRTGCVGSIGVVSFLCDITRALDGAGVTVTTLTFGARKAELAPTSKLTRAARDRAQADIDAMGELFVSAVARNRRLRAQAVRDTEAGTFLGCDAVRAGLADAVGSAEDAFLALMDAVAEQSPSRSSARRTGTTGAARASAKATSMLTTNRTQPSPGRTAAAPPAASYAHLRPAPGAYRGTVDHPAADNADSDERRARATAQAIVRADAKRRGAAAPEALEGAVRQPVTKRATAASILAADRKRRGLA